MEKAKIKAQAKKVFVKQPEARRVKVEIEANPKETEHEAGHSAEIDVFNHNLTLANGFRHEVRNTLLSGL